MKHRAVSSGPAKAFAAIGSGYDSQFFRDQTEQSSRSARAVAPLLLHLTRARSVVDVGCGVGAWLQVFKDIGVTDVLGIDGAWAREHSLLGRSEFTVHDLSVPFSCERSFDLVISLEVAEHLPERCAELFVRSLVGLGRVVAFSAAIPFQGGTNHVNEQWPDYWERLFASHDYAVLDVLRPRLWDNSDVDWWYAQNTFLFVDRTHLQSVPQLQHLSANSPTLPMRLVHPGNYRQKATTQVIGLRDALNALPRAAATALSRRIGARVE